MGETKEDRMVVGRVAHGKQEIRGRGREGGRKKEKEAARQGGKERRGISECIKNEVKQ